VQVRWAFYPATTPNAIATVFTAAGLLNAAKGLERPDLADLAMSTSGFLDSLVTGGEERYYAYVPGVATPIHNANLLVAALRARLASIGGEEPPPDVLAAVEFSLRRQRDDGSWPYGEAANLAWVDGYHTAYVLSALADLDATYTRDDLRTALIRGTRFYVECLFNPDGSPRYTVERTYPLDAHNAATAIASLAKLAPYEPRAADLSARVLRWTLANFQTPAGWFLYQRGRLHTKRVPYVRWSDAHMLAALAAVLTRPRG
jgi:hypothetical protein